MAFALGQVNVLNGRAGSVKVLNQRNHRWTAVIAWAAIIVLISWVYLPGVSGPQMLDDRSSLQPLVGLSGSPEHAADFVFRDKSGPLGRPVSMATFVLEKLYLGESGAVSKTVNVFLHLLNGSLVVWLLALLLRAARMPLYGSLAVLFGAAWLLSPLHVSTVLYSVQRMAMLSTFFGLLCCISYLYWRFAIMRGKPGLIPLACIPVFFLLAIFSKENAFVLVPILWLIEVFWLRFQGSSGVQVSCLRFASLAIALLAILGLVAIFTVGFDWLMRGYTVRNFTFQERQLTEARILWDYVGQLYWPDVNRMGLYHDDIVVSSSITQPFSTLLALVSWLLILVTCLVLGFFDWGRYLTFAVLFFLFGHSIESSILPLELYFEHRNYLPAVGLFLLPALICGYMFRLWPEAKNSIMVWVTVYLIFLTAHTSSQVQVWSSRPLLLLNYINAHPNSFRANTDMATQLAGFGELDAALDYSLRAHESSYLGRALESERAGDWIVRDLALSCIANKPLPAERILDLGKVDQERPLAAVNSLHVLVQQLQDEVCPEFDWPGLADRLAEIYLVEGDPVRGSANIYAVLAALENALQRYENAHAYGRRFLFSSPDSSRGLLMQLHFATALGRVAEVQNLVARLQLMDEEGRLTVAERQTFDLYLESP